MALNPAAVTLSYGLASHSCGVARAFAAMHSSGEQKKPGSGKPTSKLQSICAGLQR